MKKRGRSDTLEVLMTRLGGNPYLLTSSLGFISLAIRDLLPELFSFILGNSHFDTFLRSKEKSSGKRSLIAKLINPKIQVINNHIYMRIYDLST